MTSRSAYVLGAVLLLGTANFLLSAPAFLSYQYDLDYSEGFVLEDVQRFIDEGNLYPQPTLKNGFESVKYTPVFYLVFSALALVLGVSFFTGRLIVLLSFLGTLALIYAYLKEQGDIDWGTVTIPLLLFAPFLALHTGLTIRVDMLAILFSIGGIYLFTTSHRYGSVALFLLAAFTKQTFIAAFLACFLTLLSQHPLRDTIRLLRNRATTITEVWSEYTAVMHFGVLYVAGGIAGVTVLQLWNSSFLFNTIGANVGAFTVRWDLLNWVHLTFLPLLLLAGYYIYLHRDRLLGAYFGLSFGIAMLQMVRGGAWVYPMMEPFVVAVICVALLYQRTPPVRHVVAGVLIVQTVIFFWAPLVDGTVFTVSTVTEQNQRADNAIMNAVTSSQGAVYTEYTGYPLQAGKQASPEIWGVYEQYRAGRVSAAEVQSFFRQRNYTTIITYKRLTNLPIQDYLSAEYNVTKTIPRNDLLGHQQRWEVHRWTG